MTLEKLKALAVQAGFGDKNANGLSGCSEFDEELYVGEYPCGDEVLALAKLLGIEVTE